MRKGSGSPGAGWFGLGYAARFTGFGRCGGRNPTFRFALRGATDMPLLRSLGRLSHVFASRGATSMPLLRSLGRFSHVFAFGEEFERRRSFVQCESPTERQAFPHIGGQSPVEERMPDGKASLSAMPTGQAGFSPGLRLGRRRDYQLPLASASGKGPKNAPGFSPMIGDPVRLKPVRC